jgi:hypothetical protein
MAFSGEKPTFQLKSRLFRAKKGGFELENQLFNCHTIS